MKIEFLKKVVPGTYFDAGNSDLTITDLEILLVGQEPMKIEFLQKWSLIPISMWETQTWRPHTLKYDR
jgi:hypothetical protein